MFRSCIVLFVIVVKITKYYYEDFKDEQLYVSSSTFCDTLFVRFHPIIGREDLVGIVEV